MIALAPLLLLGGVVLVEQPIDGVRCEYTARWNGRTQTNTRCADLDGDGANDVITPTTAAFQRNGQFPKAQQTPLPRSDGAARADVWKNEIYALSRERIEVLRWAKSEWQRTLSQPIDWGSAVRDAVFGEGLATDSAICFCGPFVFDIDADGTPEIVLLAADGVHAFAKKGLFYEEAAVWKVLPALDAYVPPTALWPPSARRIEAPNLVKLGDIHIDAKGVSVSYNTQSADTGSGLLRYREDHYAFSSPQKLTLPSAPDRTIETDAVDPRCFRVELNDDEAIDLISVDVIGETAPPLSVPIVEVRVSTDAGKTFFSARSYGAEPWRPVTDYNGDGRLDLVLENKRLVEGGIRETLVRGLTRREVDLDISVWLQDASGVFPAKPSFTNSFTIELDRPPAYRSRMFENFVDTGLLLLDGDFDGDGIRDAAIQNRPDQITIRKGGPQGISSSVLTTLGIPTGSEFEIADVDGDGRADVVVTGPPSTREGASEATTVYLSRETAP